MIPCFLLPLPLFKVCDGTTSVEEPCDELCGGAGCNQCGGISCLKGALSKAEDSVKSATAADEMLLEKDRKAVQVRIMVEHSASFAT